MISAEIFFKVGERGLERPIENKFTSGFWGHSLLPLSPTSLVWLVSGGKLSVVLQAETVSKFLLEPSTSALVKVMTAQEIESVTSEKSCKFNFLKKKKFLST